MSASRFWIPLLAASALALSASLAHATAAAPFCKGRDLSIDPAVKPDLAAHADELVNSEGLLWKIEKDGVAPSYLYGTIHSTQPSALDLAHEAAHYIDGAKTVATELGGPFDAADKINLTAGMMSAALSADRDTIAGDLSGPDVGLVEDFLAGHGFPGDMAHHLKLWFLAVATSLPACETEGERLGLPEVDDTLAATAKSRGVRVVALETAQEQIDAVAATPPRLAAQILVAGARAPDLNDDAYVTLLNLYKARRPAFALAVLDAAPGLTAEERDAETEFTRRLLVGRNETMMQRAAPLLANGGAFIAVGALHLSGKDGLVERMRGAGYRVTKVW